MWEVFICYILFKNVLVVTNKKIRVLIRCKRLALNTFKNNLENITAHVDSDVFLQLHDRFAFVFDGRRSPLKRFCPRNLYISMKQVRRQIRVYCIAFVGGWEQEMLSRTQRFFCVGLENLWEETLTCCGDSRNNCDVYWSKSAKMGYQ